MLIFQAGAPGTDPDAQFLDCVPVAGRVRVYAAPYAGYEVPPEGSHAYELLSQRIEDLLCNDVFIVMGYRSIFEQPRAGAFFTSMPFGLGLTLRPGWPPSSSFANPIALAHFVSLTSDHPGEATEAWIDRLTDRGTRPILDPLLHDPPRSAGATPIGADIRGPPRRR